MTLFTAHFKIRRLLTIIFAVMTMSTAVYGQSVVIKGPDDGRRGASTRTPIKGPLSQQTPLRHGPITNADTLWNIAKIYRPNPAINMTQMMVALQRYNPDAFEENNLNAMVNGQYITIPSESYIASISLSEARRKFAQDNENWKRRKTNRANSATKTVTTAVADRGAQKKPVVADPASSQSTITDPAITSKKTDSQQQTSDNDEEISKLQKQFGASISNMQSLLDQNKALYSRLDTVNDELIQLRKQLNDMKSLEGQVSDLRAQQEKQSVPPVGDDVVASGTDETDNSTSSSPYLWLLLSIVPTILLIGGGALLLFRGKKSQPKVVPPSSENLMDVTEKQDDIAQQLANEMASDDLFGDDDLLDELQDSELADFDDFSDDLLVEEVPEDEQVALLSLDDEELLSDELDDNNDIDAEELSFDTEQFTTDITPNETPEKSSEITEEESFTLLDQDGLDALFEDDDTAALDSVTEGDVDNVPSDIDEIDTDESVEARVELVQPVADTQSTTPISQNVEGDLTDDSTERLIQLDGETDELVSDNLVESIVSEINTKADDFEKLSAQVLDEIEQVEQLEQMLGTSVLDLSEDIDFDSPAVEQREDNKASSYQEQQDELPLDYEGDVNTDTDDELSQALAEFDAATDENIDQNENVFAQDSHDEAEQPVDEILPNSQDENTLTEEYTGQNETSTTPSSQVEQSTDSPSMSTSFAMSMDAATDGYSTMQTIESSEVSENNQGADATDNDKQPELSPELSPEAEESELLDELEQTNFEELLESLASDEQGTVENEPELHGDPSQLSTSDSSDLKRPDLDLAALLDDSEDITEAIPVSQPMMAEASDVTDFVDVDELLTQDAEEEFVEKPFNFDAVLPPLPESTEVQKDDKGLGGKLDLALAYIEIEDFTAAKTLLDDVIQRGTTEQRSEAQTILEKLA